MSPNRALDERWSELARTSKSLLGEEKYDVKRPSPMVILGSSEKERLRVVLQVTERHNEAISLANRCAASEPVIRRLAGDESDFVADHFSPSSPPTSFDAGSVDAGSVDAQSDDLTNDPWSDASEDAMREVDGLAVLASGDADDVEGNRVPIVVRTPSPTKRHFDSYASAVATLEKLIDQSPSPIKRTTVAFEGGPSPRSPVAFEGGETTSLPIPPARHSNKEEPRRGRQRKRNWMPPGVGGTVCVGTSSAATHAAWYSCQQRSTELSPERRRKYAAMRKNKGLPTPLQRLKKAPAVKKKENDEALADRRADAYASYATAVFRRDGVLPPGPEEKEDFLLPRTWIPLRSGEIGGRHRWRLLSSSLENEKKSFCAIEIALKTPTEDALDDIDFDFEEDASQLLALSVIGIAQSSLDAAALFVRLAALHPKTQRLRCLSLVSLGLNNAKKIHLAQFTALRTLDLSSNGLAKAPQQLPRTLRDLILRHNAIASATYLEHLCDLEALDVSHNRFREIKAFHPLVLARSTLLDLRIQGNDICRLPSWRWAALKSLFPRASILHR